MLFRQSLLVRRAPSMAGIGLLLMFSSTLCAGQDAPGERDITRPARWAVMTGTDPDIGKVNTPATPTTIAALLAKPRPAVLAAGTMNPQFRFHRAAPVETTLWRIDVVLTGAQLNEDGDYHLSLRDNAGHVFSGELPDPARMETPSRFAPQMRAARLGLIRKLHPGEKPRPVSLPVRIVGIGYFGRAAAGSLSNGIQLHPIIGIQFR